MTFSLLNTFEFGWFIYGNTFFYSDVFTKDQFQYKNLWKIMIFIIVYGYITMLVYIVSILAVCCMLR
jgi:hypothetical protein